MNDQIGTEYNSTMPLPTSARQQAVGPAGGGGGSVTLVVVALALGIIVALITNIHISNIKKEAEGKVFIIYRLLKNVEPGYKIKFNKDVEEVAVPNKFKDMYKNVVSPDRQTSFKNRPIARSGKQGRWLSLDLYTRPDGDAGVNIPDDPDKKLRAVPLPITSKFTPGQLYPGLYIDIYAAFPDPARSNRPSSFWVVKGVRVAAVGRRTEADATSRSGGFQNITVVVDETTAVGLLNVKNFVGDKGFDVILRRADEKPNADERKINKDVLKMIGY